MEKILKEAMRTLWKFRKNENLERQPSAGCLEGGVHEHYLWDSQNKEEDIKKLRYLAALLRIGERSGQNLRAIVERTISLNCDQSIQYLLRVRPE